MGTKNKNEMKPISHTGCMTFNGVMRLRLNNGKEYTVRADLGGMGLNRANSNHEVVVLLRQHIGFGEVDTGFVVHAKEYDTDRCFGLKPTKKSKMWGFITFTTSLLGAMPTAVATIQKPLAHARCAQKTIRNGLANQTELR